ncbi:MAG: DNA-binding response regulator [Actinobacteria bacterium]|nr:DNA-binding response regulator [Actinomycetota bacterium]NBY15594.1 DNA-binding response regulator [Actinomycetota bacterium]
MSDSKGLILVVEDDENIADLFRRYLTREGLGVHWVSTGKAAIDAVRTLKPAVILLDVGLPDIDGIAVCQQLRAEKNWTPIIFCTARDDEISRILGLEMGGDDYITKPPSPREVVARVRVWLRRSSGLPIDSEQVSVANITLDPSARIVKVDENKIELTATEFDLLAHLMSRPGHVFSRDELLSHVWGYSSVVGTRTVDVHVAQLRAKLGEPNPIRTARGVGYSVIKA